MTTSSECGFRLVPVADAPVLSLAPKSSRMVSAYEDRAGRCHVISDALFNCAGPTPGESVTDICPVWHPFCSGPPRLCPAAGVDDGSYGDPGRIKQWLYKILPSNG